MKTKDLPSVSDALYKKMGRDGYSTPVIDTARWIIGHFNNYCKERDISEITVPVAAEFIRECFGFDYYNTTIPVQTVVRRPLLILLEFEESGSYYKTHQRGSTTKIPLSYEALFREYRDYANAMSLTKNSKERKLWVFTKYFEYLERREVLLTADIRYSDVHEYVNDLTYASQTMRTVKGILREIYDWMYQKNYVAFSGSEIFPTIRNDPRNKILSYYSKDEIQRLLSCIDTSTSSGKCSYCIICLLSYLGMRAGDIINLKFSDIDWNNGMIHYNQQKTKNPISLPLLDEVKYPLIDYIKNARHETLDSEHVFITMNAPYTQYYSTSSVFSIVDKCMQTAGIEYKGRHHGPHSLRHSLASNLMSENVPISAIANILGHASTKTTEIYLTVDETHLKEISLEVPYV
jgi:integrase